MGQGSENLRLRETREEKVLWKKWGHYLSERQWGTVREDHSEGGVRGTISLMTRLDHGRTAGRRTGLRASPTIGSTFALSWPSGTARTPMEEVFWWW